MDGVAIIDLSCFEFDAGFLLLFRGLFPFTREIILFSRLLNLFTHEFFYPARDIGPFALIKGLFSHATLPFARLLRLFALMVGLIAHLIEPFAQAARPFCRMIIRFARTIFPLSRMEKAIAQMIKPFAQMLNHAVLRAIPRFFVFKCFERTILFLGTTSFRPLPFRRRPKVDEKSPIIHGRFLPSVRNDNN